MKSKIHDTSLSELAKQFKKNNNKLMSKTLKTIVITILLFTVTANAQITKGNWMVGGSGSLYTENYKNDQFKYKNTVFGLRPNIGYFLINRLAVGVSPVVTFTNTNISGTSPVTSYGAGIFTRYYLLNPEKRINILTHCGYSASKSSNMDGTSTTLDLRGGPAFFINNSVALEMTLNYQASRLNSTTTVDILSFGIGLQIHLENNKTKKI